MEQTEQDAEEKADEKLRLMRDQLQDALDHLSEGEHDPAIAAIEAISEETDCSMCEMLSKGLVSGIAYAALTPDTSGREPARFEEVRTEIRTQIAHIDNELGEAGE